MSGIKDRVAIAGVGCTKFGELWEKDQEDLLVEAVYEALDDAGITPQDIEAAWVGVLYHFTGISGGTFAEPMKLFGKPVTRVENFCASGIWIMCMSSRRSTSPGAAKWGVWSAD